MYSSVSSGTHHIFFPPRLKVVAEKQNPNGFASDPRNQPFLYGVLCHQSNCPAGMTLRGAGTDHGDDTLLLAVFQQGSRTRSFLFMEGAIQSAFDVPMPHLPNRLRRQRYKLCDTRSAHSSCKLQQRHGAQNGTHRLNTPVQKLLECLLILL